MQRPSRKRRHNQSPLSPIWNASFCAGRFLCPATGSRLVTCNARNRPETESAYIDDRCALRGIFCPLALPASRGLPPHLAGPICPPSVRRKPCGARGRRPSRSNTCAMRLRRGAGITACAGRAGRPPLAKFCRPEDVRREPASGRLDDLAESSRLDDFDPNDQTFSQPAAPRWR